MDATLAGSNVIVTVDEDTGKPVVIEAGLPANPARTGRRGGSRSGAGRKPADPRKKKAARGITLPQYVWDKLDSIASDWSTAKALSAYVLEHVDEISEYKLRQSENKIKSGQGGEL